MPASNYRESLITAAKLYYIGDMDQKDIAELMGISRPTISRMLKDARARHIVRFQIATPETHYEGLQTQIAEALSLAQVIVVPTDQSPERTKKDVCRQAAELFCASVKDGDVIGVAWGSTTSDMIHFVPKLSRAGIRVYQLCAGLASRILSLDGHEATKQLAEALNAEPHVLNAPFVVNSGLMKNLLLQEPEIARHFSMFEHLDIAIVGMGSSDPALSTTYMADYITLKEAAELVERGLAADICGYRLHENGDVADIPLNERLVSVSPATLKQTPQVIAVACGEEKTLSIVAAARGGYITTLVIDEICAIAVLKRLGL